MSTHARKDTGGVKSARRLKRMRGVRGVLATVGVVGVVGVFGVAAAPAFAAVEVPVTEVVSGKSATGATLHGLLNPGSGTELVAYRFAYSAGAGSVCTESGATAPGEPFPQASGNHKAVSVVVTGLQPSEEYSYCLVASNGAEETGQGNQLSFTTLASAPSILAEGVASRTHNAAVLSGTVNANNQETTVSFEYSTSAVLSGATTIAAGTLSGYGEQGVEGATGETLISGTTYYYRVVAKNATGTKQGAIKSFKAAVAPEAPSGLGFSDVTATTAELEGELNPVKAGEAGTYQFHYHAFALSAPVTGECNEANAPEPPEPTTGAKEQKVVAAATGLQPNARYSFCLTYRNEAGEEVTVAPPYVNGALLTFQTAPAAPKVDVQGHQVTQTGMQLGAQINANNEETTYRFEYSLTQEALENGEGIVVKATKPLTGTYGDQEANVTVGAALAPNTVYFYRAAAENEQSAGEGTPAYGPVEELTTPPEPLLTTGQAEDVAATSAALTGTITPQGAPTTYSYQYISQAAYEQALTNGDAEEKQDPYLNGEQTPARTAEENTEPQAAGPILATSLLPDTVYYYRLTAKTPFTTTYATPQTLTTTSAPPTAPPTEPPAPPLLPSPAAPLTTPTTQPALTYPPIPFTTGTQTVTIHETPKLTPRQKLKKALAACKKDHNKTRRTKCQHTARQHNKTKK